MTLSPSPSGIRALTLSMTLNDRKQNGEQFSLFKTNTNFMAQSTFAQLGYDTGLPHYGTFQHEEVPKSFLYYFTCFLPEIAGLFAILVILANSLQFLYTMREPPHISRAKASLLLLLQV
jgi:hypothetical protein